MTTTREFCYDDDTPDIVKHDTALQADNYARDSVKWETTAYCEVYDNNGNCIAHYFNPGV